MLTFRKMVPVHSGVEMAYSQFNQMRAKLAQEIGMDLRQMEGFEGTGKFSNWNDDIIPLLEHEDNGGNFTREQCEKVYPRILSLIENWEDSPEKQRAFDFAMVLRECAEEGYALLFD